MNVYQILLSLIVYRFVTGFSEAYKSDPAIECSKDKSCPQEWPCCSQYGQCGKGPICVGGCDPRFSHSALSCAAIPALVPSLDSTYQSLQDSEKLIDQLQVSPVVNTFFGAESIIPAAGFNYISTLSSKRLLHFSRSDSPTELSEADFTYSGYLEFEDSPSSDLILAMPPGTTGSLLSSAKSFLYGKAEVTMKSARGAGVVSAMVLMSAVKDEVDFELLGGSLDSAQANYYYQGELIHTRMTQSSVKPDTYSEYHTYAFDWNEERIKWLVDGAVVRTVYRADTYDPVTDTFKYPQTPMRLELAIWPGGLPANSPGTVMWAGGLIDWENSADILENGQFQLAVKHVSITPYVNSLMPFTASSQQSGSSVGAFSYFYDYQCPTFDESCVRASELQAITQARRRDVPVAQNSSTPNISNTTGPQTSTFVLPAASSSKRPSANPTMFTITHHKNVGLPLREANLFSKLRYWLLLNLRIQ